MEPSTDSSRTERVLGALSFEAEALRRRDPSALDALFRQTFPHVYALARRLCSNDSDAEDLTQEVYLRVWQSAATFDPSRPLWPWLRRITCNAREDRRRAERGGPRSTLGEWDEEPADERAVDPARSTAQTERRELVAAALDRLPEDQRATVVLRTWQGCSHEEIADLTSSTPQSSRKRYSRAIAALGRFLEKVL